jgi:hypothetical protein
MLVELAELRDRDVGLNVAVAPAGIPVAENVTVPAELAPGVMVTV